MHTMRWYNPTKMVEEDVPAPLVDAQAIEMLDWHPNSDKFIEEYWSWRETKDVVEALIFTGQAFQAEHRGDQSPLDKHHPGMTEQEPKRLRRALDRMREAHQEAIDAIDGALEYADEQEGLEDVEAWRRRLARLEESLVDVQNILDAATQDVRNILEEDTGPSPGAPSR